MSYLDAKELSKSFEPERLAVDHVSLAIEAGEIVCLLGPSGCGKTTLLRMIAGLETPDSGTVWFNGRDLSHLPPHKREFGMMFQDFALFPHKNVASNIAFGLQMRGDSAEAIQVRVAEMLELVALVGYDERDIAQLSGGEQQRVALARALAPGPRLLMLDEPLGALDRALRERLMLDLREILKRVGVTAVYVTHDQTEAFAIADRIAVMNQGRIEQLDQPRTVFHAPVSPFVAGFLGFRNLVRGKVQPDGTVQTALGVLTLPQAEWVPGSAVDLLLKPDAAEVISAEAATPPNGLIATVAAVSFRGGHSLGWFDAAGQRLEFELRGDTETLEAGSVVGLRFDPAAVLVFAV